MENPLKSKLFWTIFIIVAAVVLVAGNGLNKSFVGETDILVLTKSDHIARNIAEIIGDVSEIPMSLKFYDKMLQENRDIEDRFAGKNDAERKEFWNGSLKISRKKNSGVLSVEFFSPLQLQARIVSEQTAKDIAVVMSRYYNINTDLEIRLIDGPIVKPVSSGFNAALAAVSILAGLVFGFLVFFIAEKKKEFEFELPRPKLKFPAFSAEMFGKKSEEKNEGAIKMPAAKEKAAASGMKKSTAPENLPVGSEFVMSSLKRAAKAEEKKAEEETTPKTHEATEEEIRNRLNKLLGGKM